MFGNGKALACIAVGHTGDVQSSNGVFKLKKISLSDGWLCEGVTKERETIFSHCWLKCTVLTIVSNLIRSLNQIS